MLRLREGAPLSVFDGNGNEFRAELVRVEGDKVSARLNSQTSGAFESPLRITLSQGVSRSERMDWTLQKATELGVAAIVPVLTARSVVRLDEKQAQKKQAHWRAIVIGACEQCGRNRLPEVFAPIALRDHFAAPRGRTTAGAGAQMPRETPTRGHGLRLVLSPSAPGSLAGLSSMPSKVELLIGPEGGLDDEELIAAQKVGFVPVRLGPRVLRTETAAVVALTVLQASWGDLQ